MTIIIFESVFIYIKIAILIIRKNRENLRRFPMDPTSIQQTKLMVTYSYQGKKYKLPFESPGKTIGDLKSEIIRRLQAVKINATPEEHHLVDKDGAQLFEEDLVADLVGVIDEVQLVKSTRSPTTQAPSSQSTQINQQSGNLTNLLQNLRNALQNSGGIHRIPPNLLQTIQHGTFRSTLSNLRGPTQNQAPSLPPRDYYKEIYKTAKIDKDPVQNIEKVFAMQFLPPITDMIEESKDNIGEMEEPINLSYRIIQSQKYLAIEKIRTFKKETLEELSERIVKKNGYDTNLFRGALYNNEGVPLTKNLMLLVSLKVEDVLNENDNIYVVLTPSQVDTKTLPKIDHNSGKDQILVNHNGTHIIRIDLSTATVSELKQKIYHKHDVPTSLQSLFYGGKPLNDTHTLDHYGIQSNSNVHLTIRARNASDSWGFQSNFHSPNLVHTKLQSIKGIREFRSHLMSIIAQICSSYTQQYTTKLLGYIRDLTQNNAPFVYSLYSLLRKGTLTLTQKIALEEGFLLLFSNVLLRSPQRPKNIVAAQDTVFEHSRAIFSAIFSYLDSLNEVPQLWKDREHYVPTETICAVTFQNLKHPVGLRFDDGRIKICEKLAVMQLINNHQQIPGIQALTEDLLIAVPEVERALQFQRFSGVQSLDLWKPKNIEIQDKTLLISDWLDLINKAQAHKLLKIYSALEIKNNAPEYSLTFNQQKELILYSGKNKDIRKPIEVFDVIQGDRTAVNADDLADALANWQSQLVLEPVINRTPKEAIIVLLDISGSMKNQYFDVAEMHRLSAVKAFFNSFADRTMAYDFHHVISLVLFNNKLTLKCDFTELFTQFKAVIETARAESTTALYDALCFGVERLNLFQQKYPHIVKRIIALTDGEDTASKKTASAAARAIQENNIILDSFVVGEQCDGLKKITFATGRIIGKYLNLLSNCRRVLLLSQDTERCHETFRR